MLENEYQKMYETEETYWWFVGKRNIVNSILVRELGEKQKEKICMLDIGCGTGIVMDSLKGYGEIEGVDSSVYAVEFCMKRGVDRVRLADITKGLPFDNEKFDIVLCLDVIEHLKTSEVLFSEILRVLKKNALVIITVPAYPFLWSVHDEVLGHKRRYTKSVLRKELMSSGLSSVKITYFNTFLFVFMLASRFVNKIFHIHVNKSDLYFSLPSVLNSIFTKIFMLESLFLRHVNFPLGGSLLCVMKKQD